MSYPDERLWKAQERPLIIYHAGCRDGFAAAWAAQFAYPMHKKAELFPGYFGQDPPVDVSGRDVYIVDFTYPRHILEAMAASAKSLTILDHHKTAAADLEGFQDAMVAVGRTVLVVFDMERSGAGIAWDVLAAKDPCWANGDGCSASGGHMGSYRGESGWGCQYARPWAVDYVEDRDLWRHALPDSHEINAYLGAVPFTFEAWDALIRMPLSAAVEAGRAIQMKIRQYCAEVGKNAIQISFEGHDDVPLVNAPQCDISELLSALVEQDGTPLAMGWWQRADGLFQYSLRSRGDLDVSALAKIHGGGGHKNAAGFQVLRPIHF